MLIETVLFSKNNSFDSLHRWCQTNCCASTICNRTFFCNTEHNDAAWYGAPFSHLFTELKISPIEVHISAIELEISPIQLNISPIELQISPNRPI